MSLLPWREDTNLEPQQFNSESLYPELQAALLRSVRNSTGAMINDIRAI